MDNQLDDIDVITIENIRTQLENLELKKQLLNLRAEQHQKHLTEKYKLAENDSLDLAQKLIRRG